MFNLRRLFKNYGETGSFNEQISPQGFIDERLFLTKSGDLGAVLEVRGVDLDRKSTRLNSSHGYISYAVFCLKKKITNLNSSPDHISSAVLSFQNRYPGHTHDLESGTVLAAHEAVLRESLVCVLHGGGPERH